LAAGRRISLGATCNRYRRAPNQTGRGKVLRFAGLPVGLLLGPPAELQGDPPCRQSGGCDPRCRASPRRRAGPASSRQESWPPVGENASASGVGTPWYMESVCWIHHGGGRRGLSRSCSPGVVAGLGRGRRCTLPQLRAWSSKPRNPLEAFAGDGVGSLADRGGARPKVDLAESLPAGQVFRAEGESLSSPQSQGDCPAGLGGKDPAAGGEELGVALMRCRSAEGRSGGASSVVACRLTGGGPISLILALNRHSHLWPAAWARPLAAEVVVVPRRSEGAEGAETPGARACFEAGVRR